MTSTYQCEYCGETHEGEGPATDLGGIRVLVCPKVPKGSPRVYWNADTRPFERRLSDAQAQVLAEIRDRKIGHDSFLFWQLGKRVWERQA